MIKNFRVLHKNGHIGFKRGVVVGECGQAVPVVQSEGNLYQGTTSDSQGPLYSKINLKIYDNRGLSMDRYSVYFTSTECLAMSEDPFHPLGFGQHSTGKVGPHNGQEIKFSDLPPDCQKAVLTDLGGENG